MMFRAVHRGWSGGRGSGSITSRAAPPKAPAFRASAKASCSTAVPRPTFTTQASRGSRAMRARFKIWTVSAVPGRAIMRFFVWGSTSSNWEIGRTLSNPSCARPLRLRPVIRAAPMPRRRPATFTPISPVPRIVKSLSRIERIGS